jgi:lipopolysaccharide heptosyltransferase I
MAATPPIHPLPPNARLLVIRLGAVGDVVRALAAVGLLRRERPDARLTWLVEEPSRLLLENNPAIDELLVFDRRGWRQARGWAERRRWLAAARDLRNRLRAARLDAVLDLQGTLKSAAWAVASGARRRVGFGRGVAREGSWLFGGERLRPPASARSRLEQFVFLVRALGVDAPVPEGGPPVPLPPLDPRREAAAGWAAERALDRRPWVVLHPGSSRAQQFKRWPAPRFAEVGRRLLVHGVGVVIGWGPGEEELAREVEAGCLGSATLAPAGDLLDLAALISRASAFVGNDTGPMHLAWAVGTPVVGLFGPTDPALNAPPGEAHKILYAGPPRRPGERRPRRPLYLDGIRPDEVEAAVLEILQRSGAASPGGVPR